MKYLELTLPTPAANLACDEALMDMCEEGYDQDILRFWEPQECFVVLGYSSKISSEVHLSSCERHRIPVLRRSSGGGTVLQGPGCLNYSLVLQIRDQGPFKTITETSAFVMNSHKQALEPLIGREIEIQGFTDMTLKGAKFSGNAQRRKRRFLLFHGTFLLRLDIALVEELLPLPVKQPAYRQSRGHRDFLTNLSIAPEAIRSALGKQWKATEALERTPHSRIEWLVKHRYSSEAWLYKF
jgi:lipoate-protein ligase A